jgi:hypothetical protein
MKTYQFSWRGLVNDLVIDVDAEDKYAAVVKVREMVERWRESEDPFDIDVRTDEAYVRVWFNLDPLTLDIDSIIDSWEA